MGEGYGEGEEEKVRVRVSAYGASSKRFGKIPSNPRFTKP